MILDRQNCFGWVQIVLVGSKSLWLGPNHFGQVQIRFFGLIFIIWTCPNDLDPTKMNWTCPKQFVLDQNYLDGPKSFWTHKMIRHNEA